MGFKLNFKITHNYLVEKIRSFILNNKNYKFTEEDLKNYKKIFPSEIEVSDLIDNRTIQTKILKIEINILCVKIYTFLSILNMFKKFIFIYIKWDLVQKKKTHMNLHSRIS